MTPCRIALANLRFPASLDDAVRLAAGAIREAGQRGAAVVCFPECYLPGYRSTTRALPPPEPERLERGWAEVARASAEAGVTTVLGTERVVEGGLRISALVIGPDGARLGFQDKVQLDPSEEWRYAPGSERVIFRVGALTFGVVICHEGWRYPETVRWAARRGAQVVFHPHFHEATTGSFRPARYGDPANTFHEKAVLCRAAENGCYFATVNYAGEGSPTTSAVAGPEGELLCHQPYGVEGVLVAEIDLDAATGLLASRLRPLGTPAAGRP